MVLLHSPPPSVSRTRFALQNRNSPLNSESRTWQPAFCFLQRPRSVLDLKPLEPAVGRRRGCPLLLPCPWRPRLLLKMQTLGVPPPPFSQAFLLRVWYYLAIFKFRPLKKKIVVKNTYQNLPPYPFLSVQSVMSVKYIHVVMHQI